MVNGASGDVVDGSGGTLYGEGSPIYQSQLTGSLGQQWQLVGLPPGPAPGNELLPPGANFYNLINASSGFFIDQPLYPIVGPDPFNGSGSTHGRPTAARTRYGSCFPVRLPVRLAL